MKQRIGYAALLAVILSAIGWATAPTSINSSDLLVNSRTTINTNFSNLYSERASLVDCSGTLGSFVSKLNGSATASTCGTLTWANILALSGTPASFVYSFNSRAGPVTLQQSDVAAVEQDLRNTASPLFFALSLTTPLSPAYGGTGVNNGTSTITVGGNVVFSGAFSPTFAIPASGTWTFPAAGTLIGSNDSGSVSNTMLAKPTTATWCGTANACSATSISPKVVSGLSAALNGASPSVATITGITAFTATADYSCTANEEGTTASTDVLVTHNVSASSFTITGTNGATATVHWICVGF